VPKMYKSVLYAKLTILIVHLAVKHLLFPQLITPSTGASEGTPKESQRIFST
jgi:hypothetical protein